MKILLCGERSFAATGLYEKLVNAGHDVDCFSRGIEKCNGYKISGDVFSMTNNKYLHEVYHIVINFILIKNQNIPENLRFIEELDRFCESRNVDRLIHISSISVYSNDEVYVNEETKIESIPDRKGKYASVKIAIDQYLLQKKSKYPVTFIRPGFIVDEKAKPSFAGIGFHLFSRIYILLGNKQTTLPLISKSRMHDAMMKVVQARNPNPVYLMLENRKETKYTFLRNQNNGLIISLPKLLVLFLAKIAKMVRGLTEKQYLQIDGLFKTTYFDSGKTEFDLGYCFAKDSICVIGAGTYGSYIINTLYEKRPDVKITLWDVGNEKIKDEKEIGYKSNLLGSEYTGLSDGRFFGFGGASAKWGGQLLMFTNNDFKNPNQFLKDIVKINEKYANKIFTKFGINKKIEEKHITPDLFIKTGIWLGYFRRNLFKYFNIKRKKNVFINKDTRMVRFYHDKNRITGMEYCQGGQIKYAVFDHYFLTAGAFESNRILLSSEMAQKEQINFSDHLSQKIFKIKGNTIIGDDDYAFRVDGTSLITKRIIGEIDGVSFFVNPIYNADFPFFQNFKRVLFKHELNFTIIKAIIRDIPSVFTFFWSMLVKKKVYVYNKEWFLFIDIENPTNGSVIYLSQDTDKYRVPALEVDFRVGEVVSTVYEKAKQMIKEYLIKNKVVFEECDDKIHIEKSEDTYHPYLMELSDSESVDDYFTRFENLLVVNTGILPHAGGINITAVLFPLIEEYINRYFVAHGGE
ncbi:MAG: NAD-dependent epimerase/dehydratase family protein [Dysgonamonadaceae bacterium]|jgi:nucleoside-diphosphate-sugar epimerase|nr:NAD-dependent epimerase/dehydratase family protein [Dysgonamonadaceae bacterium]